ncbi:hypothetical protein AMECASPLE_036494 [Ameca splendens]|uniref:Uncharacterized protein n=1 Tax=Ameca splendens TaxID=208324 RepID=A0ABV0ZH60_9TELE
MYSWHRPPKKDPEIKSSDSCTDCRKEKHIIELCSASGTQENQKVKMGREYPSRPIISHDSLRVETDWSSKGSHGGQ